MDTSTNQDSIQVFIRIKPLQSQQTVLAYNENQIKLDKHQFAFDKIFPPSATQNDVFHHVGNKLLTNVLDGYNSCIFVYGQTGSGKTHTMIGQNNGLMQQSFQQLFSRINRMKNAECFVTCSYFELYNEQLMDLLDPKRQKKLNIRQDSKKGVFVENLSEQTAFDCQKLMEVLYLGMKNRHIGQTQMNRQSSRSHSVFTISLSCKLQEDGKQILKTPKLHFVDLAGSQRQKMTQASGDRLKQAGNINKSLTTLGMVINALTSEKPRTHIPYRDSKLTCLLRDSLGGNSKTIIIGTVSSLALSFQQTLSTLNFANRAKMVKVKALINQESLSTNLQVFKQEIRKLKTQIMRLKSEHRTPIKVITHQIMSPKQITNQFQHHFDQINKKISAISDQLSQGVTSPSLEALLGNLQTKKLIGSTQTMMDEQISIQGSSCDGIDKYNPSQFIEYLNSNYELLTQINSKVNQYLQMKEQLRNAAINRKLSIQSMKTPSKFQRDQYEELLTKRQEQIKFFQQKNQDLEGKLNLAVIQKKDIQRKLQMFRQSSCSTTQQNAKIQESLIITQNQLQIQRSQIQKLKSQLARNLQMIQELQTRLKQTKQLYLYSEQKFENQKFLNNKLTSKLQQHQKQTQHQKKILCQIKEDKKDLQNEIQKLKLIIQDKESNEEQLKNELSEIEETLQFNKRMIEELTKKNTVLNNEMVKLKQGIDFVTKQKDNLVQQKNTLNQRLEIQSSNYQSQLQQKSSQIKQLSLQNDKLHHDILTLNRELLYQRQSKQSEIYKVRQQTLDIKKLLNEKQSQLSKSRNQMHIMEDSMNRLKSQKQTITQNYTIKYEAKQIQCTMIEENYHQYKRQSETLNDQLKKQIQAYLTKLNTLQQKNQQLSAQKSDLSMKLTQAQTKISSIQHIFAQNEQLKKSYKQLVKQNYRLKGKYQSYNQNQQVEKQKNDQLLSKVMFYEQKFKLMSIQYQQIKDSVKKLKQKQLQANKKLQFYQESMRLREIDRADGQEIEQKNKLISELQEENRELKYKLDNLQGNMINAQNKNDHNLHNQNNSSMKRPRQQKETASLNTKYEKFRSKLALLMKNWQGFNKQTSNQQSTQQLIDLCQVMLNQNSIKFETIAKGIRRQQKLKSQNHFILKQNIYLKERMQQLQKQKGLKMNKEEKQLMENRPRKMVKDV